MASTVNAVLAFFLFILLSPGLIVTIPPAPGGKFFGGEDTSNLAVLVHTVAFFALVKLIKSTGILNNVFGYAVNAVSTTDTEINLTIATIFFALLSPGFIVNLVELEVMSQTTDTLAVIVHAVVYLIVLKSYGWLANPSTDPTGGGIAWLDQQINAL